MSEFAKLSREERLDVLKTMPGHLAEIAEWESLHQLLTDFDFLEAKLNDVGIQALIKDYDLGINSDQFLSQGQTETLKLIQGAIRKSAQVLERDKTQLAGQLLGRLLDFDVPHIQGMLEQANQSKNSPWLRPLRANLERPGEGCLRTLTDHTGKVITVAIAPDGLTAISASGDNTLKIWDTETGTEVRTLTGHTSWVTAVDLAPSGLTAISASLDNTLKIWDLLSGKEIASFSGDYGFDCCAVLPDGVTVVAGDRSGRVHFLRLEGVSGRLRPDPP